VGDDKQALIWDLGDATPEVSNPLLEYQCPKEISYLDWSLNQTEWIGVAFGNTCQILRVY
jgi:hypothetical protein